MKTRHHSRTIGIGALLVALAFVLSSCGHAPSGMETFEGTTWIASDGSEMVFGEDGVLSWYREEGVHDGDLFEGPYEAYRGQDAYDFVVKDLKEYGITRTELDRVLSAEGNNLEDLVVYTLAHEKVIMDGKPYDFGGEVVPYYGALYDNDSHMQVVNMKTGTIYSFTKK